MTLIVVVFWVWVAASGVIFVRRRTARRRQPDPPSPAPTTRLGAPARPAPVSAAAVTAASSTTPGESAPATIDPAPPPPASVTADGETLAEALSGIAMPCDLAPLTQRVADAFDPQRITLATDSAPSDAVLAGLASELERLDYSVEVSDRRLAAQRGATAVTATTTGRSGDQAGPTVLVEVALG